MLHAPHIASASTSPMTMPRCRAENSIRRSIIAVGRELPLAGFGAEIVSRVLPIRRRRRGSTCMPHSGRPSAAGFFMRLSESSRKAPAVTTRSPAFRPPRISTRSPSCQPVSTSRSSYCPSPRATKTRFAVPESITASACTVMRGARRNVEVNVHDHSRNQNCRADCSLRAVALPVRPCSSNCGGAAATSCLHRRQAFHRGFAPSRWRPAKPHLRGGCRPEPRRVRDWRCGRAVRPS